jgi:uncharacterized protein with von Willebrand factor type A (vWA) domain
VKITALCDVSGSMVAYARPFLAFLVGLMRSDPASDAYLFHTRLVRITEAMRDPDPMRALNRLTLLSEGFGGGSRIGGNLARFATTYARSFVDARTVVFILSDGYDTEDGGAGWATHSRSSAAAAAASSGSTRSRAGPITSPSPAAWPRRCPISTPSAPRTRSTPSQASHRSST